MSYSFRRYQFETGRSFLLVPSWSGIFLNYLTLFLWYFLPSNYILSRIEQLRQLPPFRSSIKGYSGDIFGFQGDKAEVVEKLQQLEQNSSSVARNSISGKEIKDSSGANQSLVCH